MISERPFVTKADILRAYDPAGRAGEAAFKRLRATGAISPGIRIKPRRDGRIAGTITAYCALNRDAVVASRKNMEGIAKQIAKAAASVETSKGALRFAELASRESTSKGTSIPSLDGIFSRLDSADRDVVNDLALKVSGFRTKRLRAALDGVGVTLITGVVSDLLGDVGELTSGDGDRYSFPARKLAAAGLEGAGSPVLVWMEDMESGGLISFFERAWSSESDVAAASARPFDDMRPALPADLDDRLDELLANAEPVTIVGPALRAAA